MPRYIKAYSNLISGASLFIRILRGNEEAYTMCAFRKNLRKFNKPYGLYFAISSANG